MGATRNGSQLGTGGISIQPAQRVNVAAQVSTNMLGTQDVPIFQNPVSPIQTTLGPLIAPTNQTSAPVILPLIPTTNTTVGRNTTFQTLINGSVLPPILSPLVALTGKRNLTLLPPVISLPKPAILKQLTEKDFLEETLNLDTYTFVNGQVTLDISKIRCDIISLAPFKPIYDQSGMVLSTYGKYFEDLYQSSNVRDTTRKYLIVNGLGPQYSSWYGIYNNVALNNILNKISFSVRENIRFSETTVSHLDNIIYRIQEINKRLDIKGSLGDNKTIPVAFISPHVTLQQFFTSRMLFSNTSYDIFSDTKVAYQLLSDLSGILEKCSFNLIDGFTDEDRRVYVSNPQQIKKQTAQDAITIDTSYGDRLTYTSNTIKLRYITNTINMNGLLNTLPNGSANRFKFITNLLSREYKVSKGLGKYKLSDASFFSIQNRGNPFDNLIGKVPSDIFLEPGGQNSLATLFYIKTGQNNAVVLPFENRQVVGDNETVFVPGSTYFCDSILRGDFSVYDQYADTFGTRYNKAKNIFDYLLLKQAELDPTSSPLESIQILKNALSLYKSSHDLIRKDNSDPTTLLTFVMFLLANGDPNIKFEVFKLLMLIVLYDSRKNVTSKTPQTDNFRDLLLAELSQQTVQGINLSLIEENIPSILSTQIDVVKNLIVRKIPALSIDNSNKIGLQKNESKSIALNNQKKNLGIPTEKAFNSNQKNLSNVSTQVQVQQFINLKDALRGEQNIIKNIVDLTKTMFIAASNNDIPYHLIDNSSATRFNGLTLSANLFLVFELFSSLVDQFARPSLICNLIDGAGGKSVSSQYIRISYVGNELGKISNSINQYLTNAPYQNDIIKDYDAKLKEEKNIITNILAFFSYINSQLSFVTSPSPEEKSSLAVLNTINPTTLGSTRTIKSILRSFADKKTLYNPQNNPSADFYLPSGKIVTQNNYEALKIAMKDSRLLSGRRRVVSIGIPRDFTRSALSARLKKQDTYQGSLQFVSTDIVNVSIHKIDKHDEGIIYKPQTFKFDLSLFPRGFDSFNLRLIKSLSNSSDLLEYFEFYDFDEDIPYSKVKPSRIGGTSGYLSVDPYYSLSAARQGLGLEVIRNLQQSYFLDLYNHLMTGMNISEEVFIEYKQEEIKRFVTAMKSLSSAAPDYTGLKLMSQEYKDLLSYYSRNSDDFKLMLTLCNDIRSSVFRQKMYDRVFTVSFDIDRFEIDENAMMQVEETKQLLSVMRSKGRLNVESSSYIDPNTDELISNKSTYKVPDNFIMDQYFIEVELVQ